MTEKQWQWTTLVLSIPGAAAFFLPFDAGISPVGVLLFGIFGGFDELPLRAAAGLSGLSLGILGWQLRQLFFGPPSRAEKRFCAVISVAWSTTSALLILRGLIDDLAWLLSPDGSHNARFPAAIPDMVGALLALCIFLAHITLLYRWRAQIARSADAANACLVAAWLPIAVYFTVGGSVGRDVGLYATALAIGCYAALIALALVRVRAAAR